MIDKSHPVGSVICPSTLAKELDLYAVRLMTDTLGTVIPKRSILVIAPHAKVMDGDIVAMPVEGNTIRLVSVGVNTDGNWFYKMANIPQKRPLSFEQLKTLQRIVYIAIP